MKRDGKKTVTRRRSALGWSALAVALVLLWGIVKGYGFTPGQARRKMLKTTNGMEGMEPVVICDWEEHRYTQVVGGPDRERYLLYAGVEEMAMVRESFELLGHGWRTYPMAWDPCSGERAIQVGDLTLWIGEWFPYMDIGYFYFRCDGVTSDVSGISLTELSAGGPEAGEAVEIDHGFGVRKSSEIGRLSREELAYDGKNHAYGVFFYYTKEFEYRRDQDWYVQVEWTDGTVERVPVPEGLPRLLDQAA